MTHTGASGDLPVLDQLPALPVEVEVEAPHELNHSSFVLAGLFDLEAAGLIRKVRITCPLDLHRGELEVTEDGGITRSTFHAYKTTFLTVRSPGGPRRVAIDLRDAATIFPVDGLYRCDVVFKESYRDPLVEAAARDAAARILPAGPTLRIRSTAAHSGFRRIAGFWSATTRYHLRRDRDLLPRLTRAVRAGHRHRRATRDQPTTVGMRSAADTAAGSTVFFQTRMFAMSGDPDADEMHEFRAALIRRLRAEFGSRFVGGLIADPTSEAAYPDCLSDVSPDRVSYQSAMREAAVMISTRGLAGAIPWKLAEGFALGRCMVSEQHRSTLPAPLTDGEALATFETIDDCLDRCHALLADPDERLRIARNGRRYYEEWIDPPVAMHRMLTEALAAPAVAVDG